MKKLSNLIRVLALVLLSTVIPGINSCSEGESVRSGRVSDISLEYTISITDPATDFYHVGMDCIGIREDTISFRLPRWMPGYYQIMDYAEGVSGFSAYDSNGHELAVFTPDNSTWQVITGKGKQVSLKYDVTARRRFVANNFLDSTHAYIVPAATFMYIEGYTGTPVSLKVNAGSGWSDIATGLNRVPGISDEFTAPDFDILYDSPLLIGNLEKLPSFYVDGIEHRFTAFKPGEFNRENFISGLKSVVEAAVGIIGEIPYERYTFIGIGPGAGGIEHLNNTTVSFDGSRLDNRNSFNGMMSFLAHEYFHNYNVKRIRPFELGPFDYSRENRTNLLWVAEGLTVYYDHLIVRRAGIIGEDELLAKFSSRIEATENSPGRRYQSLIQASYSTWSDGPFGNQGPNAGRSISVYEKGPVAGLILDLAIRNATDNKKSLDDVMRLLYHSYYKALNRGFTDAEFQQACETVAGITLTREFEYVSTTGDIDYNTYLQYAGLRLILEKDPVNGRIRASISRKEEITPLQEAILRSWQGV
jgi:predicted metalloprotease with PDZ domain